MFSVLISPRIYQLRIKYWLDEFEKFIDNLELNLETLCQNNPFLIVLIVDLNAKSKNWYSHDKSSHKGNQINRK